jgi:hypothetical protein
MRVVISYNDGEFYLRRFKPELIPASYEAEGTWRESEGAVDLPDYIVVDYCALIARLQTMQHLLALHDEQAEIAREAAKTATTASTEGPK